jgi:SAM-dependent methyltransferase
VPDRHLWRVTQQRLTDPQTVAMIERALAHGVVLDTWMNGEAEEKISDEAEAALLTAARRWTAEAVRTSAILPNCPMPEQYIGCVFHELLFSMALYAAQKKKGRRFVNLPEAEEAIGRLGGFVAAPEGLTMAGAFFFIVSAHEDLNAVAYYGRMKKEDFLLGRLHRPWSNLVPSAQLAVYQRMDLMEHLYASEGDMLSLTRRGLSVLTRLRRILTDAGEFGWRADNQRWVIFGETNYDRIFNRVFPDLNRKTKAYLDGLGLQDGMKVLEIGAGTGRATVDLGLCDLVGPGGSVVALDPTPALLQKLAAKCRKRNIKNVGIVQCAAEHLPFPDDTFDAAIAVACLHFTDAPKAVAEMVRVTKPGGFVSALSPPPEGDIRDIPMVALWFRPLTTMAERLKVPFSEHNGLRLGLLRELFVRNTENTRVWDVPFTVSAADPGSFLDFTLKGGAFFQNIFCRLPYQERWNIMRRLQEDGAKIAANVLEKEKSHVYCNEAAYGRVPAGRPTNHP